MSLGALLKWAPGALRGQKCSFGDRNIIFGKLAKCEMWGRVKVRVTVRVRVMVRVRVSRLILSTNLVD